MGRGKYKKYKPLDLFEPLERHKQLEPFEQIDQFNGSNLRSQILHRNSFVMNEF